MASCKLSRDDNGFFLFKFKNVEEREVVIANGPWHFAGNPIILKKWEPKFKANKDLTKSVPIWVRFHNVPIQYWSEDGLTIVYDFIEY